MANQFAAINAKNEFWFDFDNFYQWKVDTETAKLYTSILSFSDRMPLGTLTSDSLKKILQDADGKVLVNSTKSMLESYLEKIQRHFGKDFEHHEVISSFAWEAFRDFGLGVLYDPRPPRRENRYVHVMDSGLSSYSRWHRFNWIAGMLPSEAFRSDKYIYLDRLLGLASELHSISKPRQSRLDGSAPTDPPNGSNITESQILDLSNIWINLSFEQIESRMSSLEDWDPDSDNNKNQN